MFSSCIYPPLSRTMVSGDMGNLKKHNSVFTGALMMSVFGGAMVCANTVFANDSAQSAQQSVDFLENNEEAIEQHLDVPVSDRNFRESVRDQYDILNKGQLSKRSRDAILTRFLKLMGPKGGRKGGYSSAQKAAAAKALATLADSGSSSAEAAAALKTLASVTGGGTADVADALLKSGGNLGGALGNQFNANVNIALNGSYGNNGNSLKVASIDVPKNVRYVDEGKIANVKAPTKPSSGSLSMAPLASRSGSPSPRISSNGNLASRTGSRSSPSTAHALAGAGSKLAQNLLGGKKSSTHSARESLGGSGQTYPSHRSGTSTTTTPKSTENPAARSFSADSRSRSEGILPSGYSDAALGGRHKQNYSDNVIKNVKSELLPSGTAGADKRLHETASKLKAELEACTKTLEGDLATHLNRKSGKNGFSITKSSLENSGIKREQLRLFLEKRRKANESVILRRFKGSEVIDKNATKIPSVGKRIADALEIAKVPQGKDKNANLPGKSGADVKKIISSQFSKEIIFRGANFQQFLNGSYPDCSIASMSGLDPETCRALTKKGGPLHGTSLKCESGSTNCNVFGDGKSIQSEIRVLSFVDYINQLSDPKLRQDLEKLKRGTIANDNPEWARARSISGHFVGYANEALEKGMEKYLKPGQKLFAKENNSDLSDFDTIDALVGGSFASQDNGAQLNLAGMYTCRKSSQIAGKVRELEFEVRNFILKHCGEKGYAINLVERGINSVAFVNKDKKSLFSKPSKRKLVQASSEESPDLTSIFNDSASATLPLPITDDTCKVVQNTTFDNLKTENASKFNSLMKVNKTNYYGLSPEDDTSCSKAIRNHQTLASIAGHFFRVCDSDIQNEGTKASTAREHKK